MNIIPMAAKYIWFYAHNYYCFSAFILVQICRALAYIHNGIGICHRDIKPQNLLVRYFFHMNGCFCMGLNILCDIVSLGSSAVPLDGMTYITLLLVAQKHVNYV